MTSPTDKSKTYNNPWQLSQCNQMFIVISLIPQCSFVISKEKIYTYKKLYKILKETHAQQHTYISWYKKIILLLKQIKTLNKIWVINNKYIILLKRNNLKNNFNASELKKKKKKMKVRMPSSSQNEGIS